MDVKRFGLPNIKYNNEAVSIVDGDKLVSQKWDKGFELAIAYYSNARPLLHAVGIERKIRLPRKIKKRYKKMLSERIGLKTSKLKMWMPNRNFKINVEYEKE